MLAYLQGTIQSKEMTAGPSDRLVMDVGGVGFELSVSRRTLVNCAQQGQNTTIHVSLCIRENDWTLFGFASQPEKEIFSLLQSVSGIGPKMALSLVGTLGPDELAAAIATQDHKLISQAPGVGTKIAQRLCLELKTKIEDWQQLQGRSPAIGRTGGNAVHEEVRSILEGLGYTPTEITMSLAKAADEKVEQDVELLVRHSLKILGTAVR